MELILLAIIAQTSHLPDVVEDIDNVLPSLNCLRAFQCGYNYAKEQFDRHTQHLDWLKRLEKSNTVDISAIHVWRRQTEDRAVKWEILSRALNPSKTEESRRQSLAWLCDLLGEKYFYKGIMPPPFPLMEYRE